jgi:hypothetical protein
MPKNNNGKTRLRSAQWFGAQGKYGFMYRSWMKNQGVVERKPSRPGGHLQLYIDHVIQTDKGCDIDFLVGCCGTAVPAYSH